MHSSRGTSVLDVGQQFPIAQRLASGPRDTARALGQRPHLVEQASLDPAGEALGDAAVHLVGGHRDPDHGHRRGRVRLESRAEGRERLARAQRDLERTHDATVIGRFHAPGRDGIEGGQPGMEVGHRGPALAELVLEGGLDGGKACGESEVVDNRPQVEAGAAHQQRMMAPRPAMPRNASRAACWNWVTVNSCRDRPGRGDGAAPRPARPGSASTCPMSMPRYTHIESTETISTSPRRRATSSAASDFPDAVTPRREDDGQAPASGIRTRCLGRAVTSSSRPER